MCFRCLNLLLSALLPAFAARQPLRVCADPNNLPFSNQQGQGFENKLAEIFAAKLGTRVEYTWFAERKSFLKNSLNAGECDLVMGVPAALPAATTTKPYYRSTYVFVSRRDRHLQVASLDDPRFADWRVGVHVVGDDYAPPAAALARRGITKNIVGFSLFGPYGEENPPRKLVDAVALGEVDIAIVWGPFAGYFARQQNVALDVVPVSPAMFLAVPFTYEISAAVRKGNDALREQLDSIIEANSASIQQLLSDFGVPQVH